MKQPIKIGIVGARFAARFHLASYRHIGGVAVENWMSGYPQELQDFMECLRDDREPQSDAMLAADTVSTLYAAYVSAQDQGRETDIPLIA